ncbi:MAG: efflux RND transporter permease subunit [Janthinobacterium lividum]
MNLSEPFIRRPVATTLIAIGIALAGMLSFRLLPVAPLPEVDFPTISVTATLPGADPSTVASSVATPLERQFGQIAGITQMTSVSSLGATRITMQFDLTRNIDGAARDVQAAISAARTNLPADLDGNPTYRKVNPADAPIMIISLTSDSASRGQLYDAASTVLEQKLLQTPGVGDVTVGGGALPAVRVELNPDRVNHYGISLEQIRTVIANSNVNLPKGQVSVNGQSFNLAANDTLSATQDYGALIVGHDAHSVVHISDLGYVRRDVENLENYGLSNSQPAVLLVIFKEPGANVIDTVNSIHAALPFLRASILPTIKLNTLMDRTSTIRASLLDVEITLLISIFLVTAVTFAFFRDWRTTLVPAIVVPLSLLATFGLMYALGFSLNNLSLMALTISTGFVVDDAIVVVENITRHLEQGEPPIEAALSGVSEVGFTVMTISISLVAVFIPLLLMGGIVGRLFREFSVSLAIAILMSMVISLTVTPMLASLALRAKPSGNSHDGHPDSRFHRFYGRTLGWVIRHPVLMGIVTLVVLVLNVLLYIVIPKGFFPQEDTGRLNGMVQASQSISYHSMQQKFQKMTALVLKNPNVDTVGGFIGGSNAINSGRLFVSLKPLGQRKATADEVIAQIRRSLANIPGARLYLQSAQDISVGGRQGGGQYQYTLTAGSQTDLDQWVPHVVAAMRKIPGLTDINTDQQDNSMEVGVNVNRDTASRLGVNFASIDSGLDDAFGQRQVSTMFEPANQYHVVMELAPEYWTDPAALKGIYVPASAVAAAGVAGSVESSSANAGTSTGSLATVGAASSGTNTLSGTGSAGSTGSSTSSASGASSSSSSTSTSTSSSTVLVPLSAMATTSITRTAISINHQGTFPAVTASFNLRPGASIGAATAAVDAAVANLRMPSSVVGQFAGTAQVFQQSVASEPLLVAAAILAVYIVLGMLYENLMHPLTILSTLPSAGVGALIALLLTHTQLTIIALVGVILLIGIVKKNAIMMIDFAITEERGQGVTAEEAITRACLVRFRPIMMTTLAAMLGAVPLVVGSGYGSEFRKPLGIAIIGGLLFSQVLTLYTTPVIYLWLDRAYQSLRRRKEARS